MKKAIILTAVTALLLLLFILQPTNLTGLFLYPTNEKPEQSASEEIIILGYCPTMKEKALQLKQENPKLGLIEFDSASDALNALKNKNITQALIGRKAESIEVNNIVKEKTLKSGYTLISKQKKLVNLKDLEFFEIETYLESEIAQNLLPNMQVNYFESKNQTEEKINQGKIVLISWDDWKEEFGLIVVMHGNEKVKEFRGEFLYYY